MDYKILFQTQLRFVKLVENSFKKNRLSQVFLFSGARGSLKQTGATYLANKLLCATNTICDECSGCKLFANNIHPNLFRIEPINNTIRKEQIEQIEKEFQLKSSKKRVLIIDKIEKATNSASNSLLKFLEEMNDNCYAILISDNLNATLSTIRSRSQIVTFEKISKKDLESFYLSKGIDSEVSRILALLTSDQSKGLEIFKDPLTNQIIHLARLINKAICLFEDPILVMNEEGKFLLNCNDKYYHEMFLDVLSFITNSRLYYLLNKTEMMIFKETILEMVELGVSINEIGIDETFKQVQTILDFKNRLLYNINIELMYMDLFIKCEVKDAKSSRN